MEECNSLTFETGAIHVKSGGTVLLANASVSNCHTPIDNSHLWPTHAGAVAVTTGGFLTLYNVTISGCTSAAGAAAIDAQAGATVRAALLTLTPNCSAPASVPLLQGDKNRSLLLRGLVLEPMAGCDLSVSTLVNALDLPSL